MKPLEICLLFVLIHPTSDLFVPNASKLHFERLFPGFIDSFSLFHYRRPNIVCYCGSIVQEPILITNHIIMLQHPNEVKRCLRTTKIIELSIPADHYHVFRGKKFALRKFPELYEMLGQPGRINLLVFPSTNSQQVVQLYDLPSAMSLKKMNNENGTDHEQISYNIIVLDGTWSQAKVLYNSNPILQGFQCIELDNRERSRYVIRTQPTDTCLSTVEAVALVLAHLEPNAGIFEQLTKPLTAICEYQLEWGAVEHQSKEYLITNGLYTKRLNRRAKQRLAKEEEEKMLASANSVC